jgi:sodium transport system permease protein
MLNMRLWVVGLIFLREVKDQLRDRRTLFMVFLLPLLLYPMLGLLTVQLAAAFTAQQRLVVVLGAEHLPPRPPLLDAATNRFTPELFDTPEEARLYDVRVEPPGSAWNDPARRRDALRGGKADVVLVIPSGFKAQVEKENAALQPELVYDSGDERSRDSARAVRSVLAAWNDAIVRQRLARDQKSSSYVAPIQPRPEDVAVVKNSGDNPWSRLFPFLLVMMSLTGAFYPAVDICAGEKERGTMETLLITPASRPEIVTGKFLTVLAASIATALVNLASMGITALQLATRFQPAGGDAGAGGGVFSLPPIASLFGMILLVLPLAAFFSALCVALAALARSMKEGQYYLTPLYLVTIPLVFATLSPGVELNLFTSMVPVTGASLLLRALMRGDYVQVRQYFLPVLLPLVVYAALGLRWAVAQFRDESVLFRESDRFDLKAWLIHLVRDRGPLPSAGQALLAFAVMIAMAWFTAGLLEPTWTSQIAHQLLFILMPITLMTLVLTSSPRATLLLRWPSARDLATAAALAVALNPLVSVLRVGVERLFPLPDSIRERIEPLMASIPSLPIALVVLALVPAICEEVAFRGFILQGLRSSLRAGTAIGLSAFLFGFLHVLTSVYQQLFNATLLGLVLGLIAVRSRSLLPGVVFHFLNNALAVLIGSLASTPSSPLARAFFRDPARGLYHVPWVVAGAVVSVLLIRSLLRQATEPNEPGAG